MTLSPANAPRSPALSDLAPPRLVLPELWFATAPLHTAARAAAVLCPQANTLLSADAVAPRREAFLAGRALAAWLLRGHSTTPVRRGEDGAPQWPVGFVGSIAHDAQRAAAAVGLAPRWLGVGVDVEPDHPLPEDAASLVITEADRRALHQAFGAQAAAMDRLVFGAKECVHKALHPWCGAWLEFDEVSIDWRQSSADQGEWTASPRSAAAVKAFAGLSQQGRWWRAEGALWTLLALPAAALNP